MALLEERVVGAVVCDLVDTGSKEQEADKEDILKQGYIIFTFNYILNAITPTLNPPTKIHFFPPVLKALE